MTDPAFTNSASGDAEVGIQANVVHGDITIYQVGPDASPEEVFRVGVNHLYARMPAEARDLIERAVARGFATDEVQFYRVLALLSGRTLRQLGNDSLDSLTAICSRLSRLDGDGAWTAGSRAVLTLLTSLSSADTALVDKELDALPPLQRDLIVDHLGVLLDGPMEDEMWRRSVTLAHARRTNGKRSDRVWTFFQPAPARARTRPVRPLAYQPGDLVSAVLGVLVLLLAVGNVIVALFRRGEPLPFAGFLAAVTGLVIFARYGTEWHFRRQRMRAKDAEMYSWPPQNEAPPHGFARGVDNLFAHYFARYVPRGADRADWISNTWGIRYRLRNEVVEIYREQRVTAKQIAWLACHLVGDVRQRWERATLTSYREELRTPARVRAACLAGSAAIIAGGLLLIGTAGLAGGLWSVLAVAAATVATRAGFRLDAERRRVEADAVECAAELAARGMAYDRWVRKLSVKPSDPEMADWLESDRRCLVDEAMRHYRLKASQIIAHAVIEGPRAGAKRARVKHGPWRYSSYQMVLFLLTKDGVRQVSVQLDFEEIATQISQRLNYRFDAVAAVRIDGIATQRQIFELTLVNGSPIAMPVTEATGEIQPGEDPLRLSAVSLDASGLPRTLDVLEGIAAEGKEWVRHQHERTEVRLNGLADALRDRAAGPLA